MMHTSNAEIRASTTHMLIVYRKSTCFCMFGTCYEIIKELGQLDSVREFLQVTEQYTNKF